MLLAGKTAIVTGAGRDIGRACAIRLAQEGAAVALNYYSSSDGAVSAVSEIEAGGGKAFAMQGDLTDPAQVQALADRAASELGGIHVVVNNSGGLVKRVAFKGMPLEHWDKVMDLNCRSTMLMVRAALEHMTEGTIVNIASQAGRDGGGPGSLAYATSKGAVMTMTRGLAKELGPNIRVNGLCPGMVDTDFHNVFTKPEVRTMVANNSPVKREGVPMDIANAVCFLATDQSAFMTGANVDINGGMLFS